MLLENKMIFNKFIGNYIIPMEYAQILSQNGVVVIPAFNLQDLQLYNTAFWQVVRSFPEYINPENAVYVQ